MIIYVLLSKHLITKYTHKKVDIDFLLFICILYYSDLHMYKTDKRYNLLECN